MTKLHPLAIRNDAECAKRKFPEPKKEYPILHARDERSPFQHDKDRILYCKSFRRLMHKTQVCFTGTMNEHIRTRLTHTLEVAQIARTIARLVGVNEDLTEAIALGHDVGHTPFGHIGEYVIHELLTGKDERKILNKFNIDPEKVGIGFKHNYQSVRALMDVETGYSSYDGLNISYPVLEGILKHSKLCFKKEPDFIQYETITNLPELHFEQAFSASIEGQIISLSDEIAQVCHDIEDAIEGDYKSKKLILGHIGEIIDQGFLKDIEDQPFIKNSDACKPRIDTRCFKEFTSWVIGLIVLESVATIKENMEDYLTRKEKSSYPKPEYYPITEDLATETILEKNALFTRLKDLQERFIINNYRIHRENGKAKFILRQIIKAYLTNPKQLPDSVLMRYTEVCEIQRVKKYLKNLNLHHETIRYLNEREFEDCRYEIISDPKFLRILSDYIASMTDLYAFTEYKKLYLEEDTGI
ncbi:dNTP triphosphohydrolase [Methanoculleus sp. FWC-SCC1]|uniref:DNTP triphosphohydrolase n=1 Tax=Methanoculleus frigidifontis TaxID=2584085 RepID=A0ABT8M856_9EURY|nr:dNTP triphosphohydrolase [Methanoculleus sp. FWC-SCC1]MDN7024117.1 dNTP triphosphohydrolase [Methanoculleus sp. FWC-SCC1]